MTTDPNNGANLSKYAVDAQTAGGVPKVEGNNSRVAIVAQAIARQWEKVRTDMILMRKACSEVDRLLSPDEMEQLRHHLPFKEETFRKYAKVRGSSRPGTTPAHVEAARRDFPRAYERWTASQRTELRRRHKVGQSVDEIAGALGRQSSAIRGRLHKLGLVQDIGTGSGESRC